MDNTWIGKINFSKNGFLSKFSKANDSAKKNEFMTSINLIETNYQFL